MQSTHCQMRVSNVLKSIDGIYINNIEPGLASISVENELQQNDAINMIEKIGYTIQQVESTSQSDVEGEIFQFKTNINCGGCIEKVSPLLNNSPGICHWDVNTNSKEKILSVHSIGISPQEVMDKVKDAGFNIEVINI